MLWHILIFFVVRPQAANFKKQTAPPPRGRGGGEGDEGEVPPSKANSPSPLRERTGEGDEGEAG